MQLHIHAPLAHTGWTHAPPDSEATVPKDLRGDTTFPHELKFCASNNLLEHLAEVITPRVDIIAARLLHGN
jgi:hypothetical protein